MTSDQVGDLYGSGSKQPGGTAFGYTVSVILDPVVAKSARGKGSFGWGGAFGTVSWTDRTEEIVAVLMVQQATKEVASDFEGAIRDAILATGNRRMPRPEPEPGPG